MISLGNRVHGTYGALSGEVINCRHSLRQRTNGISHEDRKDHSQRQTEVASSISILVNHANEKKSSGERARLMAPRRRINDRSSNVSQVNKVQSPIRKN